MLKLIRRHLADRLHLSNQQGTLMVGIGVMSTMLLLSAAVVTRTTSNLDNVRHTQDYSSALAAADAGIADALFRLDQGMTATFTGAGAAGGGTFTYTATKMTHNKWVLRSRGEVAGVPHTVQAEVTRDAEYPYAIFTEQALTFNGNGGANITSYNSTTGALDTGNAFIGSNHSITVNGGGGGDGQHYYTPAGSCSASACEQRSGPRKIADPLPPATSQPCPTGGVFGVLHGGVVEINGAGGVPFNCANKDVSFLKPTTCVDDDDGCKSIRIINGPVVIYVDGNNRKVNLADISINNGGAPAALQIMMAGTGTIEVGNGSHVGDFSGILYAPKADMVINGGQLEVNGTMTLNSLTVNGNPNFSMAYDDALVEIVSTNWVVVNYQEVPSSPAP
ncbi:MAG: DUF7305 domain-containing protein [Acidimicrobiales bacterium]